MRGFWRDLRYAARTLGRSPGLVLVATLSLGLGMGVNTGLFVAVKAVLFTDPSGSARDRLVTPSFGAMNSTSYANLRDIRSAGVFADAAGYQLTVFSVRAGADAEKAIGDIVTANYFDVLGVHAAIGRTFSAPEADPGRDPAVVVLSNRYWRLHLDSDANVVGRAIAVNGRTCTVVGVLPDTFRAIEGFGIAPELYLPISRALAGRYDDRDGIALRMLARLKTGTTRQQAEAALTATLANLERAYPRENARLSRANARLFGVSAMERLREAGAVGAGMAVSGLFVLISVTVLLIACGNVAALLVARGADRRREIAVRLALGASRGRIVRQLLAESLLLALAGIAAGWLLNAWTMPLLARFDVPLPVALPVDFHLEEGIGLLPLELVMAVVAMLLCGLAPAIESTRLAVSPALKQVPARFGRGPSRRRNLRVVWQVAGAMMQLGVAAVFLQTLARAVDVNPGFDTDRVLAVEVTLDNSRFDAARGSSYVDDAIGRVSALPGVDAVSAACIAPLSGMSNELDVRAEGGTTADVQTSKGNCVSPGYFRTMGIAMLRGRDFAATDRAGAPTVAIAGETLARRLFPDGQAVGRRIQVDRQREIEIVGVVRDSKYGSLAESPQMVLYQPFAQEPERPGTVLHVRTSRTPTMLDRPIRSELAKIASDVPVTVRPLRAYVDLSAAPLRVAAGALAVMGVLGLLLALVGLYGVISHGVTRRTSEFGIRLALGASPRLLIRGVLRSGALLVGAGAVLGLLLAVAATRMLASAIAGVAIDNPLVLALPAALLVAAGLAASYLPARRVTRVDPVTALRCE